MKRSRMRWPLILEAPVTVSDGAGGVATTWQPLGRVFASVEALAGRETLDGSVGVSRVPYRITVAAAPPGAPSRPSPRQRFRHEARVFDIVAVAEADGAGRFLECRATEERTI